MIITISPMSLRIYRNTEHCRINVCNLHQNIALSPAVSIVYLIATKSSSYQFLLLTRKRRRFSSHKSQDKICPGDHKDCQHSTVRFAFFYCKQNKEKSLLRTAPPPPKSYVHTFSCIRCSQCSPNSISQPLGNSVATSELFLQLFPSRFITHRFIAWAPRLVRQHRDQNKVHHCLKKKCLGWYLTFEQKPISPYDILISLIQLTRCTQDLLRFCCILCRISYRAFKAPQTSIYSIDLSSVLAGWLDSVKPKPNQLELRKHSLQQPATVVLQRKAAPRPPTIV